MSMCIARWKSGPSKGRFSRAPFVARRAVLRVRRAAEKRQVFYANAAAERPADSGGVRLEPLVRLER